VPGGRRPLDQADQPEPIDPSMGSYSDYIHHRHLLLLSPKADTHFTIPSHPILPSRRLSRPSWLASYQDGLPARRQSPIQVLTGPAVEQLRWFDTTRCRYATPCHQPTKSMVYILRPKFSWIL